MSITFEFVRFNPRRLRRGVSAAEIKVCEDGYIFYLWVSPSDIRKNIKAFGEQKAFTDALMHYKTLKEFDINKGVE